MDLQEVVPQHALGVLRDEEKPLLQLPPRLPHRERHAVDRRRDRRQIRPRRADTPAHDDAIGADIVRSRPAEGTLFD